ncbi:adenosine deaminase [Oscillibacter sp. PC13]|uniref:adenosine deaminase n=1 Tax=Oscillibacter sp. PC13 TaxID=1855299 RepID=UPI0008F3E671|nr:adenosine deaminase [Oscillibacter sp. PC13]SFQ03152.1 adenosine deaminase [Oscillibacter sp. PC13]
MLTERMERLIREMPKGENHIHIEGSIPTRTALRLAKRNKIVLPFDTETGMLDYIHTHCGNLDMFMVCDRLINSVCLHEEDYYDVVYDLGEDAKRQNIIYQELHLDYPLNEERGIPMDVVMRGYEAGRKAVLKDFGVELVFIAGIDRSQPPEKCTAFVKNLEPYLDMVDGIGMDCEEISYPCILHKEAYEIAGKMGLFKTAHAGEEGDCRNIWDALNVLGCQRIDHGVRAIDDPALVRELADRKILLAMCTRSNRRLFPTPADHAIKPLMAQGVICSVSSDDPPYVGDLLWEYQGLVEDLGFDEDTLITLARNSLEYSIKGQHHLPAFDEWVRNWKSQSTD